MVALEKLSDDQRERAREITYELNVLADRTVIQEFGATPQRLVAAAAEPILSRVRLGEAGEVGQILRDFLAETKSIDLTRLNKAKEVVKTSFIGRLMGTAKDAVVDFQTQLDTAKGNIDKIQGQLEGHYRRLQQNMRDIDALKEALRLQFLELLVFIAAGEIKLKGLRLQQERLSKEAQQTGNALKAQEVTEMGNTINRLDLKIYNLQLTGQMALQSVMQLFMLENNYNLLSDKIQTAILLTLPMWKTQLGIAIMNYEATQTMEASAQVDDRTDEIFKENARLLAQSSVDIARAGNRGVIAIETLQETQNTMISALEQTLEITTAYQTQRAEEKKITDQLGQKMTEALSAII